jgi:hypothetical protein
MSIRGLFRYGWIVAILLSACGPALQAPEAQQPVPSPAGDWALKLTQSGGFAGVMLTVQVASDGRLTAENQRTKRTVTQTLPADTMAQLAPHLRGVLGVTPPAPRGGCADCFLYHLEFKSGDSVARIDADDTTLGDSGVADLVRFLQQLRDQALRTNP